MEATAASAPDSRKLRLLALLGAVTAAVVLPLAVASAVQVGGAAGHAGPGKGRETVPAAGRAGASGRAFQHASGRASESDEAAGRGPGSKRDDAGSGPEDAKLPSLDRSPRLLGLGLGTAMRCGPQLTSPDGIEAQTCVLSEDTDTWARTYYRNSTGKSLDAVLSLMGPGGRSLETHCVTGGDDEPATCETPRERSRGGMDAYTAVTEFATRGANGRLLLRSGSDSPDTDGNTRIGNKS
ncbi:hypothetical protein ABT288_00660 [Streptomyces sp. NPDC001093]|uniref:hypothetical protein n=1 Tax=Streptomyces sp. NPDC001093 TaxID=3154376 RepID=UPI0033318A78